MTVVMVMSALPVSRFVSIQYLRITGHIGSG